MPRYLEYIGFCYRMLVRLYPTELRTRYGDDMAAVFRQLIHDEHMRAGSRGVALASAQALGEFFTVALPRHLVSEWLIAATLSLVITSGVLGSLVAIMTSRPPVIRGMNHNDVAQICR